MDKREYREFFTGIEPSREEKDEVWERIEQKIQGDPGVRKGMYKKQKTARLLMRTAAVLLVATGVLFMVNGISGGRLAEAISGFWEPDEGSETVVREMTDYHLTLDSVYAPQILEYTSERMIFGGTFGLVVYDRQRKCVSGTIDLQSIECNYFNADTWQTHFMVEGDSLIIFNEKDGRPSGNSYRYDLVGCKESVQAALKPSAEQKADESLQKQWKAYDKKWYEDTFRWYPDAAVLFREKMFSENSFVYVEDGMTYDVCMVLQEEGTDSRNYSVFVYKMNKKDHSLEKEKLNLKTTSTDTGKQKLPEYRYTGDSAVEKALAECFKNNLSVYEGYYRKNKKLHKASLGDCDVAIPVIKIKGMKKKENGVKVIGRITWRGFILSGKTLYESDSQGDGIAVAWLEKKKDGYTVRKVVHPRGGSYYARDLKKMYGTGYEKALADQTGGTEKIVSALSGYVSENHLDIRYYKAFGWDPEVIG